MTSTTPPPTADRRCRRPAWRPWWTGPLVGVTLLGLATGIVAGLVAAGIGGWWVWRHGPLAQLPGPLGLAVVVVIAAAVLGTLEARRRIRIRIRTIVADLQAVQQAGAAPSPKLVNRLAREVDGAVAAHAVLYAGYVRRHRPQVDLDSKLSDPVERRLLEHWNGVEDAKAALLAGDYGQAGELLLHHLVRLLPWPPLVGGAR
jgi:hypothetical protein